MAKIETKKEPKTVFTGKPDPKPETIPPWKVFSGKPDIKDLESIAKDVKESITNRKQVVTGGVLKSGESVGITTVNATIFIKTDGDNTSISILDNSSALGKGKVGISKVII